MTVNTNGTFVLQDAVITVDTGGTPIEIECAAEQLAIEVTNNERSHPRTGCKAPFNEFVDATRSVTIQYVSGFGADGIYNLLMALEGQALSFAIATSAGVASADFPHFTWDCVMPALSPIPSTAWGEFAAGGDLTLPVEAGTFAMDDGT